MGLFAGTVAVLLSLLVEKLELAFVLLSSVIINKSQIM
jgi:hypothetical protein